MRSSLIWFLRRARISLGRGCRNLRWPYKVKVPWFIHLPPLVNCLHQWVIKDPYIADGQKFSKLLSLLVKIRTFYSDFNTVCLLCLSCCLLLV